MPADTELHKAAKDGLTDDCMDIVAQGADVNAPGAQKRTALHRALGGCFYETAAALIDKGADATIDDQMKRTSLHWAVMGSGSPEDLMNCVKLVFDKGNGASMVNKQSKSSSTPLHCAITSGREAAARFLLENGADPAMQDEDGKTAQQLAKEAGMKELFGGGGGGRRKSVVKKSGFFSSKSKRASKSEEVSL